MDNVKAPSGAVHLGPMEKVPQLLLRSLLLPASVASGYPAEPGAQGIRPGRTEACAELCDTELASVMQAAMMHAGDSLLS